MKQCWIQYIEYNKKIPLFILTTSIPFVFRVIFRAEISMNECGNITTAGRCEHAARDSGVSTSPEAGSGRPFPDGTGAEKTAHEDGRIAWEDDRIAGEDDRIAGEDNRIASFEQH